MKRHAGRVLALVVTLVLCSCGGGYGPTPRDATGDRKPRLTLTTSTSSAFSPATVSLVARLLGVAADDVAFASPSEHWDERYGDLESVTEHEPAGGKLSDDSGPKLFYERTITLSDPGVHRYRLRLTGSDGRSVTSNWVTIKVILRQ